MKVTTEQKTEEEIFDEKIYEIKESIIELEQLESQSDLLRSMIKADRLKGIKMQQFEDEMLHLDYEILNEGLELMKKRIDSKMEQIKNKISSLIK